MCTHLLLGNVDAEKAERIMENVRNLCIAKFSNCEQLHTLKSSAPGQKGRNDEGHQTEDFISNALKQFGQAIDDNASAREELYLHGKPLSRRMNDEEEKILSADEVSK